MPKHTRDGVVMTEREIVLLRLLYWYTAGLPAHTPEWVKKHPLWPANNEKYREWIVSKDFLHTPCPGRDRLWEAIEAELGFSVRG